ncbi:hypothetical protein JCM5350_001405 [Sporobolomyces pararoseus]
MRLIRTCFCFILCSATVLASTSLEELPSSTEPSDGIDNASTTSSVTTETASETSIIVSIPVNFTSSTAEPVREEETASEGSSSSLATSTSPTSAYETTTSSPTESTIAATPSEPPPPPSTSSSLSTPSPLHSEEPSPTLSPAPSSSIPPLPSISIVSEVPLTSIPPVPEFLSFNEWKEKYVVVPNPSVALARRAKKAAQRQRQDVVGSETVGEKGASYDGDGTDLGSLFASGEEVTAGGEAVTVSSQAEGGKKDQKRSRGVKGDILRRAETVESSTNSLSPIQPLANVGTGDENDPLVPLKDRSNYAAFECAAMVHRSSRKTKGASAILVEKKDRYMLTPCAADPKFVEVELCDEIQIDTIVLANFEYFSSMFKHFKASCSVNYPGNSEDWHDLGTFRARNVRGVQVFRPNLIPNFCRYIRINFLSHFGSEYYCPVSLLRVYGYTQLDAYRESERKARQLQEALAAAEDYEIEEMEEEVPLPTEEPVSESETLEKEQDELGKSSDHRQQSHRREDEAIDEPEPKVSNSTETHPTDSTETHIKGSSKLSASSTTTDSESAPARTGSPTASSASLDSTITTTSSAAQETDATSASHSSQSTPTQGLSSTVTVLEETQSLSSATGTESLTNSPLASQTPTNSIAPIPSNSTLVASPPASSASLATPSVTSRPAAPSDLPIINPRPLPSRNDTPHVHPYIPPHRSPVISPPLQQPQPGESIYATIMKRLTSLEHNQTLSMHFIEAQSGMLREAFTRIERRLSEVEALRSRQEQGIRQALLDLDKERKDLERERLGLSSQVGILAQEIRLEKRLGAIQLVGTLLLIVFVGFTRSIPTSPFLHLASSAEAERRNPRTRVSEDVEEHQASTEEKSSPDPPAKPLGRRSSGNGVTKHSSGHSKRYPSLSKPGPRRHYGTGTNSSASRTPAFAKSPRAWTPPLRHSSAPPEEPPAGSIPTSLEGKDSRRRHGSNRRPGSPFEFPRRSKLDTQLGLAIDSVLPQHASTASPSSFNSPLPRFLDSNSRQLSSSGGIHPSTADEADTERSAVGDSLTNGDFDHYLTTDDEDEPPLSPVPQNRLPPPLVAPIPQTTSTSIRPPKPTIPSRPSTSMGIPFPSSPKIEADFSRRSPIQRNAPPTPPSTLPSPPPEPVLDSSKVK